MKNLFNKIKDFFNKYKERIVNSIKFWLFTIMMSLGFWISYTFIWYSFGLPVANWSLWILYALATATECLYVWWVSR